MIPRYKVQEIHDIWKTDNKLQTWLKVELAHLDALMASITDKVLTDAEYNDIIENVSINKDRWLEIERETHHDVQAFVQMLEESVPNNSGRWIHYGLTSSDVIDTSLSLMCKESISVILNYCGQALYTLNKPDGTLKDYQNIITRFLPAYLQSEDVTYNTSGMSFYDNGSFHDATLNLKFIEYRPLNKLDIAREREHLGKGKVGNNTPGDLS